MTTINKEVIDAFVSTLQDLTVNSKPLINVLTMIADENEPYSKNIVEAIETHLSKVRLEVKLPILYLIDCIIKNVGRSYTQHFCHNIVTTFCSVFQVVDEKTRAEMFKLRQTWSDVLPKAKLYAMDVQIRLIDPAWPITAHLHPIATNTIHVNPKFLTANTNSMKKEQQAGVKSGSAVAAVPVAPPDPATLVMQQKLLIKQKELVELQQKKIELELLQTKVKLEEEKLKSQLVGNKPKQPVDPTQSMSHNLLLKPEVAKQLDNGCSDDQPVKPSKTQFTSSFTTHQQQQQSYTIPKQSQQASNRFAGAAASRDPRLARLLQQQQANSDPTATNSVSNAAAPATQTDNNIKKKQQHGKSAGNKAAKRQAAKSNAASSLVANKPKFTDPSAAAAASGKAPRHKNSNSRFKQLAPSSGSPSKPAQAAKQMFDAAVEAKVANSSGKRRNYARRNNVPPPPQEPPRDAVGAGQVQDATPAAATPLAEHATPGAGGDTDLRSLDSFVVPSARREGNQSPKLDLALKGVDVDLRQIPTSGSPSREKKRTSNAADNGGPSCADSPPAKKSKSQVLDALFGSEDVDLRQAATATSVTPTRPTTPPPPPAPIISVAKSTPPAVTPKGPTPVAKANNHQQEANVKKAKLDALRAKLANVSNKEKLKEKQEQKKAAVKETTKPSAALATAESLESAIMRKIIMSTEDVDSIKAGKLSKEQEIVIMAKIKSHFENEKLAQAKSKEKEDEEQQQQVQIQPQVEDLSDSDDEVIEVVTALVPPQNRNVPLLPSAYPLHEEAGRLPLRTRGGGHQRGMPPHPWRSRPGNNRWEPLSAQQAPPWQQQNNIAGAVGNSNNSSRGGACRWRDGPIPPPPMPPPVIDITQPEQPMLLQSSAASDARSINIDSCPRDIRFYEQTAVVFMAWDDPREISFQHGARRVIFDDVDVCMLQLNSPEWTEVAVGGLVHRVKLGAPTRELWLDGRWHEAVFGGRDVPLELDGRLVRVKLEGPPPQVRIGTEPRTDLVCGKIQLIVDAKTIIPVFLDSLVQQITISATQVHQLQFVDALRAVRFDGGEPVPVEFGGLPKPVYIAHRKHFVRFSVLPRGVRPGYVRIKGMEGEDRVLPLPMDFSPVLPHIPSAEELAGVPLAPPPPAVSFPPLAAMDEGAQGSPQNLGGNFDALSNAANVSLNTSETEYHVETTNSSSSHHQPQYQAHQQTSSDKAALQPSQPAHIGNVLNINDLFQKLLATGIVSTQQQPSVQEKQQQQKSQQIGNKEKQNHEQVEVPVLQPVVWTRADSLKTRQSGLVHLLYSGMQCSSCGERFHQTATGGNRLFSQHLDWHFRQNRRGKHNAKNRKATSRRWYYSLADWKQYEEIEDLKEREKNFFENQQQPEDGGESTSQDPFGQDGSADQQDASVSVACDPDTTDPHCTVCDDRFEQFYNEELEEWHLRNAICVDGQIYHPICYKDQQMARQTASAEGAQIPGLDMEQEAAAAAAAEEEAMEDDSSNCVEEVQVIQLDDEDENVDQRQEEVQVIDESQQDIEAVDDDDDDVILNEVLPEQIILDEYEWRDGQEPADDEIGLIPGVVVKVEPLDDGFMDVGDSLLKPKEPDVIDETATATAADADAVVPDKSVETEDTAKTTDADEHQSHEKEKLMTVVEQGELETNHQPEHGGEQENGSAAEAAVVIEDADTEMVEQQQPQPAAGVVCAVDPLMANIDGNIDMCDKGAAAVSQQQQHGGAPRIRINISKAHAKAAVATAASDHSNVAPPPPADASVVSVVALDPTQPLPPGEETPLKPALRGLALRRQPPLHTGTELTGLCSIM